MAATHPTEGAFASYDRKGEWRICCAQAMGFDWVDRFDNEEEKSQQHHDLDSNDFEPAQQVINLLDGFGDDASYDDDDEEGEYYTARRTAAGIGNEDDHWAENARRIQHDISRMTRWIRSKRYEFVGVDMPEDEASLIQSTVTSFSATTASELETLRNMITSSSNRASHRAGVIQILLGQLKEQVVVPFGALQKQRTRVAVQLWQHPLQCKIHQPKRRDPLEKREGSGSMSVIDLLDREQEETQREQRFLPRKATTAIGDDYYVIDSYEEELKRASHEPTPRPDFLNILARRISSSGDGAAYVSLKPKTPAPSSIKIKPLPRAIQQQQQQQQQQGSQSSIADPTFERNQQLQQEALLLNASVQNDLDSVQQMEQRMVDITTLIGQFSNLVSEQQEDIAQIHDAAQTSKENMDKGQEQLVDATERTKQSKHYLAWSIVGMSFVLMFFHILRP